MKHVAVFDVGGTLIADPFPGALSLLNEDKEFLRKLEVCGIAFDVLTPLWQAENSACDFPFASHFLQEEIWIRRALLALRPCPGEIAAATLTPLILHHYRAAAFTTISVQPHLPRMHSLLETLWRASIEIHAASNDRQFATYAMLCAAGIEQYFKKVFTSEGMSDSSVRAEKPAAAFFERFILGCEIDGLPRNAIAYIGDSEPKDIAPARALGLTTVRVSTLQSAAFEHAGNTPSDATVAAFSASTLDELETVLVEWALGT